MAKLVNADVVSEMLCVGTGKAYQVIRELNQELKEKGFMTVRGRVPIDYVKERFNLNDKDIA